jgi:CheY-like chemotaxis protein
VLEIAIHVTHQHEIRIQVNKNKHEVIVGITMRAPPGSPLGEQDAVFAEHHASLITMRQLTRLCGGMLSWEASSSLWRIHLTLPMQASIPVLVFDDSEDQLSLLQRYVSNTRYRLVAVMEPHRAVELVQTVRPIVIIIDVMMPRVDGWEVLSVLRSTIELSHIPVVILSILPLNQLALDLGADAFLSKPISQEQFIQALDHWAGTATSTYSQP